MWKLSSVHFRSPRSIKNNTKKNKTGRKKKKHLKVKYPFRDHSTQCPWGAAVTGWRRRSTLSVFSLLSVSTRHSKNVDKFLRLVRWPSGCLFSFYHSASVSPLSWVTFRVWVIIHTDRSTRKHTHAHTSADVNKLCAQEPADHRCSGSPASRT